MGWLGNILKSVVGSIPVVGGIAKTAITIGETLLSHKKPVGGKINILPPPPSTSTAGILSQSPVMPGGGIATAYGILPQGTGNPPSSYGRSRASGKRRKRARPVSHSRKTRKRGSGGITYRGKHYSARQAKYFVPRGRR